MGIDFIVAKEEKFTNQSDAAFEDELASENLLSRLPDTVAASFRCRMIVNEAPSIGDGVLLYKTDAEIRVLLFNRHIANVMAADALELEKIMASAKTDVLSAAVSEVRELTKTFIVRMRNQT